MPGIPALAASIRAFFLVCDRLSDHIVLIYQEIHCLPSKWRNIVLDNEKKVTDLFSRILADQAGKGELCIADRNALELAAHNISVLGHMWAFRRWLLSAQYSIDQYIEIQTRFILSRYQASGHTVPGGERDGDRGLTIQGGRTAENHEGGGWSSN